VEAAKHEVQFSERTGRDISFPFWRKIHFCGTKNREILIAVTDRQISLFE
jgi:hypothetical protein